MLSVSKQLLLLLSIASLASCDDPSLQTKCAPEFAKLSPCLDYSTGKANAPSSECCNSASDIRKSKAVCLCYIIQQSHNRNENATSLGIRFDRLLSLPADCNMPNTTLTNCPTLLNLSPSSPDYGIFTNTSKGNSSSTAASANGNKYQVSYTALLSAILLSIF